MQRFKYALCRGDIIEIFDVDLRPTQVLKSGNDVVSAPWPGADVAVLIVDDANGCGLSTRVFADEDEAFSVVHHACAATTYSLAHEIGHLIGARHDRNMDATPTPFAYGHGYVNGTKWRDIMSYKESCDGCSRLPVWSGPNVMVNGEPAGSVDLDNARVIREHAARVAGFR